MASNSSRWNMLMIANLIAIVTLIALMAPSSPRVANASSEVKAEGTLPDIALPETPPLAKFAEANPPKGPEDLDKLRAEAGLDAHQFDIYAAVPADLTDLGIGKTVYIPVAISNQYGGRSSIFFLKPGQEVLMGIYTTNDGMLLHYVRRESGTTEVASKGDVYSERITNRDGKELIIAETTLEYFAPERGVGVLRSIFIPTGGATTRFPTTIWCECEIFSQFRHFPCSRFPPPWL